MRKLQPRPKGQGSWGWEAALLSPFHCSPESQRAGAGADVQDSLDMEERPGPSQRSGKAGELAVIRGEKQR